MRILFDKNVPAPLRGYLSTHRVETSALRGWGELKNGIVLRVAEADGFDVLITADQNIAYQQNLAQRKIALVVLGNGNWPVIRDYTDAIITAVDGARPNSYTCIEMRLLPRSPYKRTDP